MNQEILSLMSSLYFIFQEGLIKIALAWLNCTSDVFITFLSNKLLNGGIIKNCVVAYIALGLWPFFHPMKYNGMKLILLMYLFMKFRLTRISTDVSVAFYDSQYCWN